MKDSVEQAIGDSLGESGGIEVKGLKGMHSKPFRKTFKSEIAYEKWYEKNKDDVEITGYRDLDESKDSVEQAIDNIMEADGKDILARLATLASMHGELEDPTEVEEIFHIADEVASYLGVDVSYGVKIVKDLYGNQIIDIGVEQGMTNSMK